jgi:hypothetical protein
MKELLDNLRRRISEDYDEFNLGWGDEWTFKPIDEFLAREDKSDLEKAFFLILNQFPGDAKNYIVIPSEKVLIPDVYDMSCPGIAYEIDFALYGGSLDNPVKVAIECDGLRSHGQKYANRDRRKDVNLQAAGWIVMRFGSREIHEELDKFQHKDSYTCHFLLSIENLIEQKSRIIDGRSYAQAEFRSKLTGFRWGDIKCQECSNKQYGIMNYINMNCRGCGKKTKRLIEPIEAVKYVMNGLIFY